MKDIDLVQEKREEMGREAAEAEEEEMQRMEEGETCLSCNGSGQGICEGIACDECFGTGEV